MPGTGGGATGRPGSRPPPLRGLTAAMLLIVALVVAASGVASAGTDPSAPPRCEQDGSTASTPGRCVGPVTDKSGGGGDVRTVAIGVVVGLAVAGVAFVLVRRQLSAGAGRR